MKFSKFFVFVGVLFAVSVVVYLTTTQRGTSIPLTGIVTGNDVIVSSQIAGRMIKLTVDEGSQVHKGDLIAEIDPAGIQATIDVVNGVGVVMRPLTRPRRSARRRR